MIRANLKSSNLNSENSYLMHFHIANKNFNLFLTDEKMNKLMKSNQVEKKAIRPQNIASSSDTYDLNVARTIRDHEK